jgi:hypothetical protein
MKTEKRKKKKNEKKKTNRKLQARNCVPITLCIFQPSSYQIQSPLVATTYEKKTNVQ